VIHQTKYKRDLIAQELVKAVTFTASEHLSCLGFPFSLIMRICTLRGKMVFSLN
jgi:hypothetical protein